MFILVLVAFRASISFLISGQKEESSGKRRVTTNTPRLFHAETTEYMEYNVEYMWCVCRVSYLQEQLDKTNEPEQNFEKNIRMFFGNEVIDPINPF